MGEIGELCATFLFSDDDATKAAYDQVCARCRWIAVYRWTTPGAIGTAVTIMGETEPAKAQVSFGKADAILRHRGGRSVDTPTWVAGPLRARRQKNMARGGGRFRLRTPAGHVIAPDGTDLGPLRRPQG